MRRAAVCLLLLGSVAVAAPPTLKDARLRWLRGNYEEAQELYEKLLKDGRQPVAASLGLSQALASQGEYDKAQAAIDKALKDLPKNADLHARRAELLHFRGKWDDADKAVASALAANKNQLLARWVEVQLLRDRGDLKKADKACKALLDLYNSLVNTPKEIKAPEDLVIVGLASSEYARWSKLSNAFEAILEDLYGDAFKSDKNYWPAELQAGLLLLEKFNRAQAIKAFDKVLTINPTSSETLTAKGRLMLQRFDLKEAEELADTALKFNPNLPEALRLRADLYFATGDFARSIKMLDHARKISPNDELTLARLAASYMMQGKKDERDDIIKAVEKFTKTPGVFYRELAERLEDRKRYTDAEGYYQKAMKLRPELAAPINHLGMLYMRLGKEKEASDLLDKGFKADPFNLRVSNMRKVLKHLKTYKEIKTKHFILRYDAERDPVLAKVMADYLERIYEELAVKFDHRPEGPFLIQLFRTHQMFSGRMIAMPDLHTIGACTGRVVALVSPNEKTAAGKAARKAFNWARVLRHEVVHLFNLDQTGFQLPHWFTEGLAVQYEAYPRSALWNRLLLERVPAGNLLTLDTIDLAFIRPQNALQWQQAYLQALLYVEYIQKEHKPAAVGKMLAAFAKGKSAVEAVALVRKVDKATFEKGYRKYLEELVSKIRSGKAAPKRRTLAQLRAEYKKKPDDPDVCAEMAMKLVGTRRVEARKLAEEAIKNKKNHPKANYVLATLAMRAADTERAKTLLEAGLNKKNPEPVVLKALGKFYYEAKEYKKAAEVYELGRKAEPFETEWLQHLARVYARTSEKSKQVAVLKALLPGDPDDLTGRNRLARLLSESKKWADAEKYARQALEIDVTNKDARETLYKALGEQKKDDELKRMKGLLEKDE